MADQPTVIIHNHAGGSSDPKPPGRELSRYHHPADGTPYTGWIWHPSTSSAPPVADFEPGKTYVLYELDDQ